MSGDATEVREVSIFGTTSKFIEAEGILGAPDASLSVTFTASASEARAELAIIAVVPAS